MLKSRFLKFVVLFIVICTTLFFICFFYLKYKEIILIKLGIEAKQSASSASASVFGTLLTGTSSTLNITSGTAAKGIQDIINFRNQAGKNTSTQAGSGVASSAWDYKTSYMWGYIVSKDLSKGVFTVWISVPSDKPFSKVDKEVKVNCTPEDSALIIPMNLEITDVNVDVLYEATAGNDGILAYCMDENCTTIGRSCAVLMDFGAPAKQ